MENQEIIRQLDEIITLLRLNLMTQKGNDLRSVLKDEKDILIYHLSDGNRSTREIASMVKDTKHQYVATLWKRWLELGLGEGRMVKGGGIRFRHLFDPQTIGLTWSSNLYISSNGGEQNGGS